MTLQKTCFVICPLDAPSSPTRNRSDQLLKYILEPELKSLGYAVSRADIAFDEPSIPATVSRHVLKDDLVIADLTDSNANVFYELGKRHALNAPCVQFATSLKNLPFDVRHYRTIEYKLEPDQI